MQGMTELDRKFPLMSAERKERLLKIETTNKILKLVIKYIDNGDCRELAREIENVL